MKCKSLHIPGLEEAGIAEVLFEDYNFKGKSPHFWPKLVSDFKGEYRTNF
ncbi:hypothetical protein [Lutibacter citreus]|nr:hypothetical protein [Lutibacter citreus]